MILQLVPTLENIISYTPQWGFASEKFQEPRLLIFVVMHYDNLHALDPVKVTQIVQG